MPLKREVRTSLKLCTLPRKEKGKSKEIYSLGSWGSHWKSQISYSGGCG